MDQYQAKYIYVVHNVLVDFIKRRHKKQSILLYRILQTNTSADKICIEIE